MHRLSAERVAANGQELVRGKEYMKKSLFDLDLQMFAEDEVSVETEETADLPDEEDEAEDTEEESEEVEDTEEEPEEPSEDFKNEENAHYASIRRKAEADAKAKADARIAAICKGVVHPRTGKPITTLEEYEDALYVQDRMASEKAMRDKGLDPRIIDQAIQNNPTVRQAEAVIEQQRLYQAQAQLEADIAEISKLDPSIKTFNDLNNLESIGEIVGRVNAGMSLLDAFKTVEFNNLLAKGKAGAKQSAINQTRGKAHLQGADSLAEDSDEVEIPKAEYLSLKEVFPNKTRKELTKLYNQTMRKLGGKKND